MALYIPDDQTNATEAVTQMATTDLGASFVKMFLSLIVLILLMFTTYWFLRRIIQARLQKNQADASIHILEKRPLSPKTMLYLLEVEGKKVLIAESQLEVRRLEEIRDNP